MTPRRALTVFAPAGLVFLVAQLWLAGWPCTLWQALSFPAQRLMAPSLASLVEPDESSVRAAAKHLARIEPDPGRQGMLIASVLDRAIWYRRDLEVYGELDVAVTPTRMQALARECGWPAMRGDCDDYAIYGASLASALGIGSRLKQSTTHVWVEVMVEGEWRSIFANGCSHAAPPIEAWKPVGGADEFERNAGRDPARAASLRWLRTLPRDPERGHGAHRRLGSLTVYGLAGMCMLGTGLLLDRRHFRAARGTDVRSWPDTGAAAVSCMDSQGRVID